MPVYFARWKDGSFSIVDAADEEEAYLLLDEFGDEPAVLAPLNSCLIDFELTDAGAFRLRTFGDDTAGEIFERGYPMLDVALQEAVVSQDYSADWPMEPSEIPPEVAQAVEAERKRLADFEPAPSSTELGRDLQKQTNLSGRNVDAMVRRKLKEVLKDLPLDEDTKPN